MTTRREDLQPLEAFLLELDRWDEGTGTVLPAARRAAAPAAALVPVGVAPSRLQGALASTAARTRLLRGTRERRILSAVALVLALALAPTPTARLATAVRFLLDLLAEELAPDGP